MKIAEAFVEVRPKTDGFEAEARRGIESPMKKMAAGVGAALATAGAIGFARGAITEAREAAKVSRLTEAAVRSTGGAANVTADDVGKLSERLSNLVGVDDEVIQSANNVLLTFTKVRNETGKGNKIYDQAAQAALNMSVALKQDLQSATLQVGKALNDPIAGITALTRAGVQFTDQQKAQISALVEAGDTLGAQKIILGELETQFGGAAEAAADPAQKLSVAWGNVQEQLGTFLLPILQKVATVLVEHKELIGPLAALIGGIMVTALAAYTVNAIAAAAATLGITAPVALVVAAVAGLAAGVIYAYNRFEIFRNIVRTVIDVFRNNWGLILAPLTGGLSLLVQHFDKVRDIIRSVIDWLKKIPGWVDKALGPLDEIAGKGAGIVGKIGGVVGKINPFDDGGIVGGRLGSPQLILAHGGETVLPTHRQSGGGGGWTVVQNFYGSDGSVGRSASQGLRDAAWLKGL